MLLSGLVAPKLATCWPIHSPHVSIEERSGIVFWGFYGPLAGVDLLGAHELDLHITLGQVVYSLVVGMSGGRILTLEAEKAAERAAKTNLLEIIEGISKEGAAK